MKKGTKHSREKDLLMEINNIIADFNIGQRELAERCGQAGYTVNQSTISKLLSGKQKLTVEHVEMFAEALGCSFDTLVENSCRQKNQGRLFMSMGLPLQSLLMNPQDDREAFYGYLGKYQAYFLSTSTTEKGRVIKAELRIEEEDGYCHVKLTIPTDAERPKEYDGQMLISKEMKTGYIFLLSAETGEITSVYIRYRRMRIQELLVRVGLMLTVSSGDHTLPTVGYLLLTRQELDECYIADLLRMSEEYYIVSDANMELRSHIDSVDLSAAKDKPFNIEKRALRRKLLNSEKEQEYLDLISLLHRTAWNTMQQIQIDEETDLEFFEINRILGRRKRETDVVTSELNLHDSG